MVAVSLKKKKKKRKGTKRRGEADEQGVREDWGVSKKRVGGVLFVFFQAEDGIRDVAVTGVQTCALPISRRGRQVVPSANGVPPSRPPAGSGTEIGRASCRERG